MVKVNVEGSPEAVAKFFKELGKDSFEYPSIGQAPLDDFSNMEYHYPGVKLESVEVEPSEFTEAQKEKIAELVETDPKVIEKVTGKKPGRPKKEKAETSTSWEGGPLPLDKQPKFVEPEVVTPDPEFSDLPDVAENATTEAPEIVQELEKSSVTRLMVREALREYGIWLQQTGEVKQGQIKPYLLALLRKYGNKGVTGTPDLEEQYFEAVMQAAVSRVPVSELEEYL